MTITFIDGNTFECSKIKIIMGRFIYADGDTIFYIDDVESIED